MSKRHSRIFSLQLANHDASFGPREKPPKVIRILRWIALTPAVLCFLMPSFHIGIQAQKTPAFPIPDTVQRNSIFTLPSDPGVAAIHLSGRPLPVIHSKNLYLAHASAATTLYLEIVYRGPERRFDPKTFFSLRFEHPTYDAFSKLIRTEPDVTQSDSTSITSAERKLMTRFDGEAQATCWKKPKFDLLAHSRKIRPNIWTPRFAALTAAAPGEVIALNGTDAAKDKSVILYHGGGLYSIYRNAKDFKVHKGDRVKSEQLIASAHAGSQRQPIALNWSVVLAGTEISPENFLKVSSQLCDSM